MNINDYVWALVGNKKDECIDFFIEDAYQIQSKDLRGGSSTMTTTLDLIRSFWSKKCSFNLSQCHEVTGNQNIRVHYFDNRQLFLRGNIKDHTFGAVASHPLDVGEMNGVAYSDEEKYNEVFHPDDKRFFHKKLREVFDIAIGLKDDIYTGCSSGHCRFSKPNIFDHLRGLFNFSNDLKGSSTKDTIQIFLLKTIGEKIQKELGKLDRDLDKDTFIEVFWDTWIESFEKNSLRRSLSVLEILELHIGTMITDIYLLARVFMDYDMSESKKNRGCPHQSYNKNIIIYGGSAHIELYNLFIKKLYKKQPLYEYKSRYLLRNRPKSIEFSEPLQFFLV